MGEFDYLFGELMLRARVPARRWRASSPDEFDRIWRNLAGDLPAWLAMRQNVSDRVEAWLRTPTWEAAASYLEQHRAELLDPDADAALLEFGLVAREDVIAAHRTMLAQARERTP